MSVSIQVEGLPEAIGTLDDLNLATSTIARGLLQVADNLILPAIMSRATSVWNIRTAMYSTMWYDDQLDDSSIKIANMAQNMNDGWYYAWSLETGWRTRNGGAVMSPGVAEPALEEIMGEVASVLQEWIASQVPHLSL